MYILPFPTVLILTAVSIVLELDSTKNIETITIDEHKNNMPPKKMVHHFFLSLYST